MLVCFFMSNLWWNLLPQYWLRCGRVSERIRRCVNNVELYLRVLPHCLHENVRSLLWNDLERDQLKKIKLQFSSDIRKGLGRVQWPQSGSKASGTKPSLKIY